MIAAALALVGCAAVEGTQQGQHESARQTVAWDLRERWGWGHPARIRSPDSRRWQGAEEGTQYKSASLTVEGSTKEPKRREISICLATQLQQKYDYKCTLVVKSEESHIHGNMVQLSLQYDIILTNIFLHPNINIDNNILTIFWRYLTTSLTIPWTIQMTIKKQYW